MAKTQTYETKPIDELLAEDVASITDHTFLKTEDAYKGHEKSPLWHRCDALDTFLSRTIYYAPFAVCVLPRDVRTARSYLPKKGPGGGIRVVAAVGFPDPFVPTELKVAEAREAIAEGANEIDMVLNYHDLHCKKDELVQEDLHHMRKAVPDAILQVILETSELTKAEVKHACVLAKREGVDFVKTSTGYASGGADVDKLILMRDSFKGGVKASGGITVENYKLFLKTMAGGAEIELNPYKYRLGASKLLHELYRTS